MTSPLAQIPLRRLPWNFPVQGSFVEVGVVEFGLQFVCHVGLRHAGRELMSCWAPDGQRSKLPSTVRRIFPSTKASATRRYYVYAKHRKSIHPSIAPRRLISAAATGRCRRQINVPLYTRRLMAHKTHSTSNVLYMPWWRSGSNDVLEAVSSRTRWSRQQYRTKFVNSAYEIRIIAIPHTCAVHNRGNQLIINWLILLLVIYFLFIVNRIVQLLK